MYWLKHGFPTEILLTTFLCMSFQGSHKAPIWYVQENCKSQYVQIANKENKINGIQGYDDGCIVLMAKKYC